MAHAPLNHIDIVLVNGRPTRECEPPPDSNLKIAFDLNVHIKNQKYLFVCDSHHV